MTDSFILDYYLLVLLAAGGVFQVAAARARYRGLLIIPHRGASYVLGLAMVVVGFAWFFLSEPRNVPDSTLGLDGNQQFGYFFAGSGTALFLTLIVTSMRHRRARLQGGNAPPGLEALREASHYTALWPKLTEWAQRLRGLARSSIGNPGQSPKMPIYQRAVAHFRGWSHRAKAR